MVQSIPLIPAGLDMSKPEADIDLPVTLVRALSSAAAFAGQLPPRGWCSAIELCVRCYVTYRLSYRDLSVKTPTDWKIE
jgi:hypothetical protein